MSPRQRNVWNNSEIRTNNDIERKNRSQLPEIPVYWYALGFAGYRLCAGSGETTERKERETTATAT
jgi:hypothetical protein